MMTIPSSASALHLDLLRVAAMRAGAGCTGTTALSEGGSTSPCLISTSLDGPDGAEVSVLSLLIFGCLPGWACLRGNQWPPLVHGFLEICSTIFRAPYFC